MFCQSCLKKAVDKLLPDDIIILEYLLKQNATIAQCSISRNTIKDANDFTPYKCYTALDRLECYDMIAQQSKSKANKYYITESGKFALKVIESQMSEVR